MVFILDKPQLSKLQNEYQILHLIYHRNKNQHRMSIWWKYFNILHRNIRKLLKLIFDIDRAKASKAQLIEGRISNIVDYLISRKVLTKAYYEFNGIITLGQFMPLGLTLTGCLARIWCILQDIKSRISPRKLPVPVRMVEEELTEMKDKDPGEDLGEDIEFTDSAKKSTSETDYATSNSESLKTIFGNSQESTKPRRKKSKKANKKRNAINDIFG